MLTPNNRNKTALYMTLQSLACSASLFRRTAYAIANHGILRGSIMSYPSPTYVGIKPPYLAYINTFAVVLERSTTKQTAALT
jgi:hypothetical protein